MKILSIDFDFFQDVTAEKLKDYPIEADMPPALTELLWAKQYAVETTGVRHVRVNKHFYYEMLHILKNQRNTIPVLTTSSHVHAYNFVREVCGENGVELWNVDLHHDMVNSNEELDCGNWIGKLAKTIPTQIHWITRDLSLKTYDFKESEIKRLSVETNFKEIKDMQFDAVFLCRSDPWLPPHLDSSFKRMLDFMREHFQNVEVLEDVDKERAIRVIFGIAERIRKEKAS